MGAAPAGSGRAWGKVAALVIGFAIFVAVVAALRGDDEEPSSGRRCEVGCVTVFVIASEIPEGTFGGDARREGWFDERQLSSELAPRDAVRDLDEIEDCLAVADLPANLVLTSAMFVPADAVTAEPTVLRCG